MLLEPKMLENIIVGLLVDNRFNWYVSPKDLWFLDRKKLEEAYMLKFKEMGLGNMGSIQIEDERSDIEMLDEYSIIDFTSKINKYAVASEELRALLKLNLLTQSKEDVIYTFSPSLYINFDKKELYSLYSEPASYENFVPENWTGVYEDFSSKIASEDKYWHDENGMNLLDLRHNKRIR